MVASVSSILGLFPDWRQAQPVIHELKGHGFLEEQLGLVYLDGGPQSQEKPCRDRSVLRKTLLGIGIGGLVGCLWAWGASIGFLPSFLSGERSLRGLMAVYAGLGLGLGICLGAVYGLGRPNKVGSFDKGFRRGHILVAVQTEDRAEEVKNILGKFGVEVLSKKQSFPFPKKEVPRPRFDTCRLWNRVNRGNLGQ